MQLSLVVFLMFGKKYAFVWIYFKAEQKHTPNVQKGLFHIHARFAFENTMISFLDSLTSLKISVRHTPYGIPLQMGFAISGRKHNKAFPVEKKRYMLLVYLYWISQGIIIFDICKTSFM